MLRVGLLGLGYWGPNYARVLRELPEARLVRACDPEPQKLELIRRRDPEVELTTRSEEVLGDDAIDALIVSTPSSTHAELTQAGLEAGKHVLCEKPLATGTADCDRLIAAAERAGTVLMVGHTFIFNPAVRRIRELVDAGEIGEVLYCHASRTGLGPIREDVNALWDLAPHDVSMILWITGKRALDVSVTGESYLRAGYEDVAFMSIRLTDRVLANVHVSWLDPYKIRTLTLIGDRRMVVFDDLSATEKLRLFDKGAGYEAAAREARGAEYGEYRAVVREGDITIPKLSAAEPLKEQLEHFLRCCRTGERPETDGRAGREVVAVLEAASKSLHQHGGAAGVVDAVPVA